MCVKRCDVIFCIVWFGVCVCGMCVWCVVVVDDVFWVD